LSFANTAGLTSQIVVPDPYYGGDDGFEQVFQLINIGCEALLTEINVTEID